MLTPQTKVDKESVRQPEDGRAGVIGDPTERGMNRRGLKGKGGGIFLFFFSVPRHIQGQHRRVYTVERQGGTQQQTH